MEPNDATTDDDRDWELFLQADPGDQNAFRELVGRHFRAAIGFCTQVLNDPQLAEDVVQKGFVKLFGARDRYSRQARFRTLLFRVLLRLCINELQRKKVARPFTDLEDEESEPIQSRIKDGRGELPEEEAERKELGEMIRAAVMTLNPKHRAALYLREYEQLAYADVATALDATLSEVKIWIHRGRQAVQQRLRPYLERGERVR